jgi:hypothetical protein
MRVPIVKLPVAVFSHPSGYDPGGAIPTAGRSSANDVAMARDRAARMLDARMVMVDRGKVSDTRRGCMEESGRCEVEERRTSRGWGEGEGAGAGAGPILGATGHQQGTQTPAKT